MVITTRIRPDYKAVTVRDYLNTFFYYRKIAVSVFLAVLGVGLTIALMVPMPYKAEATLLVLFAGYYDQSNNFNGGSGPQLAAGQLVGVESQILSSPELHRAVVVSQLGGGASSQEVGSALQKFGKSFHLEQNDVANTLSLSYSDSNPERASEMLSRLIDQYFLERAAIFTSGRVAFLEGQRDEAKAKLDKSNADMLAFQKANGIVDIDDQISRAVALEAMLVQRGLENDAALAQDRSSLEALLVATRNVQSTVELFTDNSEVARALDTMQIALVQLESRRADFASRYMESSPFVRQLDEQIADMRESIERQKEQLVSTTRRGRNSYYDVVQDRLASLRSSIAGEAARQREIRGQIEEAAAKRHALIEVSNQLRQMQANHELLADSYQERARQAGLAGTQQGQVSQTNGNNVRLIQAPITPSQRSVSASMIVAASLLAGLMISGLTVLILASLRETFLSPEQVERALSLPVLSSPVSLGTRRRWLDRWPRLRRFVGGGGDDETVPPRVLPLIHGRTIAAINASSDSSSKVVMALSFARNEGLVDVVRGLALELEHRSGKPILILDMASSSDMLLYGKPDERGALNWPKTDFESCAELDGGGPVVSKESLRTLVFHHVESHSVVVARPGGHGTSPSSWQDVASQFDSLRQGYDYILVHAPPVSHSFAGIEYASLADATILTIRAETTRKPVVFSMYFQVRDSGGEMVGVVLTHRKGYIPNFIYRFFNMLS